MPSTFLKKGTPPQSVELNQSELRVLKDLASAFLNVDLSQLEALLDARASLPNINADSVKPSILTPLDPSPASKLEAQAARPASQPRTSEPRATPKRPSKSPTPTHSMASARDSSFINARINQNDSSRPTNINNFCNNHDNYHASSQDFNNSSIDGSTIINHSNNNNIHHSNVMPPNLDELFKSWDKSWGSPFQ